MCSVHTKRQRRVNVYINVMLTGGTFDLSDGYSDGQNGLHTHFGLQRSIFYVDGNVNVMGSLGVDEPLERKRVHVLASNM